MDSSLFCIIQEAVAGGVPAAVFMLHKTKAPLHHQAALTRC